MVRGPRSGAQAVDEHVEQQAQAPLQPANLHCKGLQCRRFPPGTLPGRLRRRRAAATVQRRTIGHALAAM